MCPKLLACVVILLCLHVAGHTISIQEACLAAEEAKATEVKEDQEEALKEDFQSLRQIITDEDGHLGELLRRPQCQHTSVGCACSCQLHVFIHVLALPNGFKLRT